MTCESDEESTSILIRVGIVLTVFIGALLLIVSLLTHHYMLSIIDGGMTVVTLFVLWAVYVENEDGFQNELDRVRKQNDLDFPNYNFEQSRGSRPKGWTK